MGTQDSDTRLCVLIVGRNPSPAWKVSMLLTTKWLSVTPRTDVRLLLPPAVTGWTDCKDAATSESAGARNGSESAATSDMLSAG